MMEKKRPTFLESNEADRLYFLHLLIDASWVLSAVDKSAAINSPDHYSFIMDLVLLFRIFVQNVPLGEILSNTRKYSTKCCVNFPPRCLLTWRCNTFRICCKHSHIWWFTMWHTIKESHLQQENKQVWLTVERPSLLGFPGAPIGVEVSAKLPLSTSSGSEEKQAGSPTSKVIQSWVFNWATEESIWDLKMLGSCITPSRPKQTESCSCSEIKLLVSSPSGKWKLWTSTSSCSCRHEKSS